MKFFLILYLILFSQLYVEAFEADTIEINPKLSDIRSLYDLDKKYTAESLPNDTLFSPDYNSTKFGFLHGRIWLKFEVNLKDSPDAILELKNALLDHVVLFKKEKHHWKKIAEQGDVFPFDQRAIKNRFHQFVLNESGEYLLSIESRGEQTSLKMKLLSRDRMKEVMYTGYLLSGFYFGVLLLVILVALFVWIFFPGKRSFYLFCFVLSVSLVQLTFAGYGYRFFWSDYPYFQNRSMIWGGAFSAFFLVFFIKQFFETRKRSKKINFVFNFIAGVLLLLILSFFSGNSDVLNYGHKALSIVILLLMATIVTLSYLSFKSRFKPARLVFVAVLCRLTGVVILFLYNHGVFENYAIAEMSIHFGITIMSCFLVLALIDSYRISKDASTKQTKKITLLVVGKNKFLKQKVEERTKSLEDQKEKLEVLNQELVSSINVAKDIQKSLVNSENQSSNLEGDNFVIYKPKEIVHGDFYWTPSTTISDLNDRGKKILAVGDTNQTGVSGAMMGVLSMRVMETVVFKTEAESLNHKKILKAMDSEFRTIFSEESHKLELRIDLGFCTICKKEKVIEFSGANMNLYLRKKNGIQEVKGLNRTLGQLDSNQIVQTTEVPFESGDVLYLFTDGIVKELERSDLSVLNLFSLFTFSDKMEIQKSKLYSFLNILLEGNKQLDDITVVGLRL